MFVRNDRKVLLVALLSVVVATACGVSDRKVSVSDPEINGGAAGAETTKDDGGSASGGRTSKGTAKSDGGVGGKATRTSTVPSSTGGMTTASGGTATSQTGSGGTAQIGGTASATGGTVTPCILDVSNLDACVLG